MSAKVTQLVIGLWLHFSCTNKSRFSTSPHRYSWMHLLQGIRLSSYHPNFGRIHCCSRRYCEAPLLVSLSLVLLAFRSNNHSLMFPRLTMLLGPSCLVSSLPPGVSSILRWTAVVRGFCDSIFSRCTFAETHYTRRGNLETLNSTAPKTERGVYLLHAVVWVHGTILNHMSCHGRHVIWDMPY